MAAIALATVLATPQAAVADGDPASDVLATQSSFLPWDAGLSSAQQGELAGLVSGARRAGVRVRVAVIASAADMGSVTALWHQPRRYAVFLGEELSLVYHGALVVVMPNGLGVYDAGRPPDAAERAILDTPAPRSSPGALLAAASSAVRRIAAASGHAITPVRPVASARARGAGIVSRLALAVGAALIAAAWIASVHARPLRLRSHW